MKVLKAIIIDDEPLAHKVILQYVEDIPFISIVTQCYLATEAYEILDKEEIDLIFLDINMPKLKGLDFLRTLSQAPKVIITSAYEEYALDGYELQVSDYLLKPFRLDRFMKAINQVREDLSSKDVILQPIENDQIFVKVDRKHIHLNVGQIQYLESYGNYVKIWVDQKMHLTPRTLSSFESELNDQFIRIHKSFIIQKRFINYVEGNLIYMKNGNEVSIGKSYKSKVKEWLK